MLNWNVICSAFVRLFNNSQRTEMRRWNAFHCRPEDKPVVCGSEGESWCLYPIRLTGWSSSWACCKILLRRCMPLWKFLVSFFCLCRLLHSCWIMYVVEILQFLKYLKNDGIDDHLLTNLQWGVFSISLFQFSHQTGSCYVCAIQNHSGLVFKFWFFCLMQWFFGREVPDCKNKF